MRGYGSLSVAIRVDRRRCATRHVFTLLGRWQLCILVPSCSHRDAEGHRLILNVCRANIEVATTVDACVLIYRYIWMVVMVLGNPSIPRCREVLRCLLQCTTLHWPPKAVGAITLTSERKRFSRHTTGYQYLERSIGSPSYSHSSSGSDVMHRSCHPKGHLDHPQYSRHCPWTSVTVLAKS